MEFSSKQRTAMTWWTPRSPWRERDVLICDGAVRSGKTLCIGLGFFLWASTFRGRRFALCGKTVGSVRRNVLAEVTPWLEKLGLHLSKKSGESAYTVRCGGRENTFYLFGGQNEASASLIQGMTLTGVLLDEAVLMPRSFVEQACARCSAEGARIWMSCNPQGPEHWLYREWILQAENKNCLYLHFTMEDNPSLSASVRRKYRRRYTGTFYRRFILGEWVGAEGRVYDFFDPSQAPPVPAGPFDEWYISCDYGTVNPASFGLWGRIGTVWYRVEEFYHDSRQTGVQMTDQEYADALRRLAAGRPIRAVVADPSAASFLELLRREGWRVIRGKNDVLSGIRVTADLLKTGRLVICAPCADCLREFSLYVWDGSDRVKKEHDHAMDDMRYFAATVVDAPKTSFAALAIRRGEDRDHCEGNV